MTQRILVTSHCQTGGLASCLAIICKDVSVEAFPLNDLPSEDDLARKFVSKFDIWVTSRRDEIIKDCGLTVALCPEWHVTTFHPDIVYVNNLCLKTAISPPQASRIAAWAYNAGLTVQASELLFNRDVFEALGYLGNWNRDRDGLKSYFQYCGLDFMPFYLSIRRRGVFMHDPGHPHSFVLMEVARALARKLNLPVSNEASPKIPELWEHITWPVYPEIARDLGLQGSYVWCEGGPIAGGLRGYLEHIFARFSSSGVNPGNLGITSPEGIVGIADAYDSILVPFVS